MGRKTFMKMKEIKIEGYWYSKYEPQYPMPVPNVLTQDQAQKIYNLILEKEKESESVLYRGWSTSRITGEDLGNVEYEHPQGWNWPGDFAKHYVLGHRVKPTDDFLEFIGYE